MRIPLIPFIALLVLGVLVDLYVVGRLKHSKVARGWRLTYIVIAVVATAALLCVGVAPKKSAGDAGLIAFMWTIFGYMTVYVPKYIFTLFSLAARSLEAIFHRNMKWLGATGAAVGALAFGAMWWGALVERYNIDVKEVVVTVPDLPKSFDGYRIVQISDIHTGTFGDNPTFLKKIVETVNELKPDAIMFTGDIVNRHSVELEPFTSVLSELYAPDSVWSVMGNHDYGDYHSWPSPQAKEDDISCLRKMQRAMGWHMLDNNHAFIRRDSDSIAIIGVENIGDPPFHCYGSLGTAYPTTGDDVVKILMSHNPAHWVDSIADCADKNIALTLSGHTHAMQFEICGWSPAKYRYPTWGGLYSDSAGRHLYVNIGLGEVGFPARIGATPEITLITLKK